MRKSYLLIPVILLLAGALTGAGCLFPSTPPVSPTPTPIPTEIPPAVIETPSPTFKLPTTAPTQTVPDIYAIDVQVDRNEVYTDPYITAAFRGGLGINFVSSIEMKVTRSDGTIETASMSHPKVGDSVQVEGTTDKDRVEVIVTLTTGKQYEIFDQIMPFRAYH